ncbi:hypothetical protein B0H67DRAFT_574275 [Lasiosphaeris hirsuta]|uniref:Uncharacterized protein n=1 Tax=Lasiosphaeris hirsuta TaxID=260670 RepID=A0AA40E0J0_9PEZI|nr:hypothetical protein B0H67DRAFT_574275 [Lasiosphaeris hirsuta]
MEQYKMRRRGGGRRREPLRCRRHPTEGLPWVTALRSPVIPAFLSWIITAMSMLVLSCLKGEGLRKLVHELPVSLVPGGQPPPLLTVLYQRFDPTSKSQLSALARHIVSYGVPVLLLLLLSLLEIVYWINTVDLFRRGRWKNLHLLWVAPATVFGTCLSAFAVQDPETLFLVAVPVLLDFFIFVCLISDALFYYQSRPSSN